MASTHMAPLVFVGGSHGAQKTPTIKHIISEFTNIEHFSISKEVKKLYKKKYGNTRTRMRDLSILEQKKLAYEVVCEAKNKAKASPKRVVLVEGHFTCSHNSDRRNYYHYLDYSPLLDSTARDTTAGQFDLFVLLSQPISAINDYRISRGKKPSKKTVVSNEIKAEKQEALQLQADTGKPLIIASAADFPKIVTRWLSRYAKF
jgi:hypothetical protein